MDNSIPSSQQLNRTVIASVLFIDIVGYARQTMPDQQALKELFIDLLTDAIQCVATSERIMVDTGDGAGIAFLGDPEHALFAALTLRDAIDAGRATLGEPGFVRMGINLGPLKTVRDINGHANMIGDGVNDAQRIMSFADPGQVMVSRAYYDIVSRFSHDYAALFVYQGTRQDKHVREHEVYCLGSAASTGNLIEKVRDRARARQFDDPDTVQRSDAAPFHQSNSGTVSLAQRRITFHPGMLATAIGAIAITGAVWSWTDKPGGRQADQTSSAASVATGTAATSVKMANTDSKAAAIAVLASTPAAIPQAAPVKEPPVAKKSADKPAKKDDRATPAAKAATLKLAVRPWGEIYVDGSRRGVSPPLKSLSLAPGKHQIEIRNGEFAPHKQTVEVKSGTEITIQVVF